MNHHLFTHQPATGPETQTYLISPQLLQNPPKKNRNKVAQINWTSVKFFAQPTYSPGIGPEGAALIHMPAATNHKTINNSNAGFATRLHSQLLVSDLRTSLPDKVAGGWGNQNLTQATATPESGD